MKKKIRAVVADLNSEGTAASLDPATKVDDNLGYDLEDLNTQANPAPAFETSLVTLVEKIT